MALGFSCSACGNDVIVQFLKVGEAAQCKRCGAKVNVPPDARAVELPLSAPGEVAPPKPPSTVRQPELPSREPALSMPLPSGVQVDFSGKRAWSPTAIFWFTVVFSVLAGGIMWSLNYARLGLKEKRLPSLIMVLLGSATCFLIAHFFEDVPQASFLVISIVVGRYFMSTQENRFDAFIRQGGTKARILVPLNICLFITCVIIYVFYFSGLAYQNDFDKAARLAGDGDLRGAIKAFSELQNDFPEEPDTYYSLARVYERTGDADSALGQISSYLKMRPEDSEAVEFSLQLRQKLETAGTASDSTSYGRQLAPAKK